MDIEPPSEDVGTPVAGGSSFTPVVDWIYTVAAACQGNSMEISHSYFMNLAFVEVFETEHLVSMNLLIVSPDSHGAIKVGARRLELVVAGPS